MFDHLHLKILPPLKKGGKTENMVVTSNKKEH